MRQSRREFLRTGSASIAAAALGGIGGCASMPDKAPKVVVVGGGFAGATAAKYVRKWSDGKIAVTLVERASAFVSCPLSNLVLGGSRQIADLTVAYDGLDKWGVRRATDEAMTIDPVARTVRLSGGTTLAYDRLILAPGVDFMWDAIPALASGDAQEKILHAWKAGAQTVALRRQLEAMPDGGVFVMHIPKAPYRCPPGPYERACQVAFYFKQAKPRSKVIILDANEDVVSKPGLFKAAWNDLYKGTIEYRGNNEVKAVDARAKTLKTDFDTIKGDVLNVLPPMRAGDIARTAWLLTPNTRWCGVDWLSMESTAHKGVHVLGDATLSAPAMPKSGHMANNHGKLAAAAIIELMNGRQPNPQPVIANTCYSFVSDKEVIHVASVHRYDPAQKTLTVVPGASGVSAG